MKKITKLICIVIVLFFMLIYINRNNNYYENQNILTQEAITRFENDLKEGKEIIPSNYLEPEKNYNNKASKYALKISSIIEKSFNKLLKKVLNYIAS